MKRNIISLPFGKGGTACDFEVPPIPIPMIASSSLLASVSLLCPLMSPSRRLTEALVSECEAIFWKDEFGFEEEINI